MKDYKILHIKDKPFSLLNLDELLLKQLPGYYKLYWYSKDNTKWEITLKWDGTNYIDLYQST